MRVMNEIQSKVSIGFITYNTAKYLPYFLASLKAQTFTNFEIVVADNSEGEENECRKYITEKFPDIKYKWMGGNFGFARAYNYLIEEASLHGSKYFLVINPDIICNSDVLEKLVLALDTDNALGSVCPKILSWDYKNKIKTNIIDTRGIVMYEPLRFIDYCQGDLDGDLQTNYSILGPSGAAGLFRMSALARIKDEHGYFDNRMFMYKEDCDLDYRLSLADFKSKCLENAVIYHDRTAKSTGQSLKQIFLNRKNKSKNVRRWSFINQQIILCKHWSTLGLGAKLSIIYYQIKILLFAIIFEPYLLRELPRLKGIIKQKTK